MQNQKISSYKINSIDEESVLLSKLIDNFGYTCIVCKDNKQVMDIKNSLDFFSSRGIKKIPIQELDIDIFSNSSPSIAILSERIDSLVILSGFTTDEFTTDELENNKGFCVITTIKSLLTQTIPRLELLNSIKSINVGDRMQPKDICEFLLSSGYVREDVARNFGEFASRGSVVDFAKNSEFGYRILFDEFGVEKISVLDVFSQLSLNEKDKIKICPANEAIKTISSLEFIKKKYKELNLYEESLFYEILTSDLSSLESTSYIPIMYECGSEMLFDYIPKSTKIIFTSEGDDIDSFLNSAKSLYNRALNIQKGTTIPFDVFFDLKKIKKYQKSLDFINISFTK